MSTTPEEQAVIDAARAFADTSTVTPDGFRANLGPVGDQIRSAVDALDAAEKPEPRKVWLWRDDSGPNWALATTEPSLVTRSNPGFVCWKAIVTPTERAR